MRTRLSALFWVELIAAAASAAMVVVTSIWPQWIELLFDAEPDAGSGKTEWLLAAAALCVATVILLLAARWEWRRTAGAHSR